DSARAAAGASSAAAAPTTSANANGSARPAGIESPPITRTPRRRRGERRLLFWSMIFSENRRPLFGIMLQRSIGPAVHHARRHVLEPALRLHEALELRRERARVEVMHDEDAPGILDHHLVHALEQLGALTLLEGRLNLVGQRVELLAVVPTPIQPDRA